MYEDINSFWLELRNRNYEGLREQLFPSLTDAYAAWLGGDAGQALLRAARTGAAHFRALATQVLVLHERLGRHAGPAIEDLLAAPGAVCPASCAQAVHQHCPGLRV